MRFFAVANHCLRWRFALALLALLILTGCVERRMTIRSNPPGAQVYVDDYEIGTTPVSTGYIYYGTRKIRLVKDGYETLTVYQPMPPPWYDWFGIDFFSENIWPGKIRDERAFDYQMNPIINVPTDELRARAEQLRSASQVIPAAAPPVVTPPPAIAAPQLSPVIAPPPVGVPPATTAPIYSPPPTAAAPPGAATIAPPPAYGPPGGYPPAGAYPGTYPAPGAYPAPTALPPPSSGPQFNQPAVAPGWRPIGEAPTPLQR
jgi:hypothetical protein